MTFYYCCSSIPMTGKDRQRRSRIFHFPRLRFGLLSVVVVCSALGCGGKSPQGEETAPPAPVEAATARTLFFGEWTELVGATQPLPNRAARVTAAIEGRVFWLLHDPAAPAGQSLVEGQRVEQGQAIGRLGTIQTVPGQTLAVGATVAEVVDLDQIDVLCFVPPHTAGHIALDQPARVVSDQKDAEAAQGKVVFIAVQAQPDTGCFAVKVRFPNPDLRLRSGLVLRIETLTKPEQARITVPETALLEDQDPPSVIIVQDLKTVTNEETGKESKTGTARKLRAKLGVRDRRWHVVEILALDDLKKKEQITLDEDVMFVVKGGHGLENGDKVKLEEEDE